MKTKNQVSMLRDGDRLSEENLTDIVGGTAPANSAMDCTCDCWIGNTNEEKTTDLEKGKINPAKGL